MNKTSLRVMNLTIAGLLAIDAAEAQERAPGSTDPSARASPDDPRLRLSVEQTVASLQHASQPETNGDEVKVGWGAGGFELGADYRAIDRFEFGLAVAPTGSHMSGEADFTPEGTSKYASTTTSWALNPRVGYQIPLASSLALVPRVGVEYVNANTHSSNQQAGFPHWEGDFKTEFLSLKSGLLLEYRPVPWLFFAPVADFAYQMHTNYDGDTSWFSEQPYQLWRLDMRIAAGARI